MDKKVEVISENLPRKTNFRIMDLLIQEASWKIASDTDLLSHKSFIETNEQKDLGFTYTTFDLYQNIDVSTELNTYANLLFDLHQKYCRSYKLKRPIRYIWNYYNRGSEGTWHVDNGNDPDGDYVTAIYNLNMSDGALEIEDVDGVRKYLSRPSESVLFHSGMRHRGLGPKNFTGRFNLAMMMELNEDR